MDGGEGEVHNQGFPNLQTFSPVSCLLPTPLSEFTQMIPLGLPQLAPSALILPCHSKLTPPMLLFLKGTLGFSQLELSAL